MDETVSKAGPPLFLHLGAGSGGELASYLDLGATRIILVEANPEIAASLREAVGATAGVEVVERAVAVRQGAAQLHVYNRAPMSSLRKATGLRALHPDLRTRGKIKVETMAIGRLIDDLSLSGETFNTLVVDIPGEEHDLVSNLIEQERHFDFPQIVFHCGRESLYEGAAGGDAIVTLLTAAGYDVQPIDTASDADRPAWRALATPAWETGRLSRDLAMARCERSALEARARAAEEAVAHMRSEFDASALWLRQTRAAGKRGKQMQALLDQVQDRLANARNAMETIANPGNRQPLPEAASPAEPTELERMRDDLSAAGNQIRALDARLAEAMAGAGKSEQALAAAKGRIAELEGQLKAAADGEAAKLSARQEELTKARQDLSAAIGLRSMAQSDLSELQDRYAQLLEARRRQEALLGELTQRLRDAARHLRASQPLPDGVSTLPRPQGSPTPATGAAPKRKAKRAGGQRDG